MRVELSSLISICPHLTLSCSAAELVPEIITDSEYPQNQHRVPLVGSMLLGTEFFIHLHVLSTLSPIVSYSVSCTCIAIPLVNRTYLATAETLSVYISNRSRDVRFCETLAEPMDICSRGPGACRRYRCSVRFYIACATYQRTSQPPY